MQRIFVYISSLLLCLSVNTSIAQQKKQIINHPDSTRWLNGFTLHIDAASILTSTFMNSGIYSTEGGFQLDLKHKIFPTIELGVAGANKFSTDNINFKTNGLFERIGVDFNLRKNKPDSKPTNNLFLAGIRLGMSNFNYNVTNVTITDNFWGGSKTFDYPSQNSTKIWYEFVVGVQVEVITNFYMGWNIRNKNLISKDILGEVAPWYIPGFGQNNGSTWGFNYIVGYHFWPQKKAIKNKKISLSQEINKQINKQ